MGYLSSTIHVYTFFGVLISKHSPNPPSRLVFLKIQFDPLMDSPFPPTAHPMRSTIKCDAPDGNLSQDRLQGKNFRYRQHVGHKAHISTRQKKHVLKIKCDTPQDMLCPSLPSSSAGKSRLAQPPQNDRSSTVNPQVGIAGTSAKAIQKPLFEPSSIHGRTKNLKLETGERNTKTFVLICNLRRQGEREKN
ncbi:hypothetical protein BDZ45DRAFT_799571 [Acephala macrosclerotiorum]|nr:hypothetical protein BDZ45DRAFT_799571 [Acephala macrosclerotiorum]